MGEALGAGANRSVIQQTMRLVLNGQTREVAAGISLPGLLDELGIDRRVIAVAHNGEVVPRDDYENVQLQDGDRIEVVRMVGGG